MGMIRGDANPVVSTTEYRMSRKMSKAPRGRKLILKNEGGSTTVAVLTNDNVSHFIEWAALPASAIDEEDENE